MKKNEVIKPKIDIPIQKIRRFCLKNHIQKLALFGSVLTNHFRKKSNIDMLVEFDSKHIPGLIGICELQYELEEIVGRQVDLRTPNDLSPYFRNDVISKAYHLHIYGKERFCAS
jgi:predicted nucleotidyltransferase